jgi:hypothetical protein
MSAKTLQNELNEVMNLKWTRGLSVSQALEVANEKKADLLATYRFFALNRRNEAAFQDARENALLIEYIVETLESALAVAEAVEAATIAAKVETVQTVTVEANSRQTVTNRQSVARPTKTPCPFFRSVKRFYAIATEAGLDTSNDEAIRKAIGAFFGIELKSRKELSGGHWQSAGDALERGLLSW